MFHNYDVYVLHFKQVRGCIKFLILDVGYKFYKLPSFFNFCWIVGFFY